MRLRRGAVLAVVLGLVAATFPAGAEAAITGWNDAFVRKIEPPADVRPNRLESPTAAFAFDELQRAQLTEPVSVDALPGSGPTTFRRPGDLGNHTVAAGQFVDSHLIHVDPVERSAFVRGSVTFSGAILGVIVTPAKLAASDSLGAPGTRYAGNTAARGLVLDPSDTGTQFTVSRNTLSFQIATPATNFDELRVLTARAGPLTLAMRSATRRTPGFTRIDERVTFSVTVTNRGERRVTGVSLVDNLPVSSTLGVEFLSAPRGACPDADRPQPVYDLSSFRCDFGALAPLQSVSVSFLVRAPSFIPTSGLMTNSASVTPGGLTRSESVQVGTSGVSALVPPGGSITTGGANPATVTLPPGPGEPVRIVISQGPGDFCNGPCTGTTTTVSDIPGYTDPNAPIVLTLEYNFAGFSSAVAAAAGTFYKFENGASRRVERCSTPGVAIPAACIDGIAGTYNPDSRTPFRITVTVLLLSWDPRIGYRSARTA